MEVAVIAAQILALEKLPRTRTQILLHLSASREAKTLKPKLQQLLCNNDYQVSQDDIDKDMDVTDINSTNID